MTALHFGFSWEREIGEGREGWDNESHRPSLGEELTVL